MGKTTLWVWRYGKGVDYHEFLKPAGIIKADVCRQQMINLNHALIEPQDIAT